MKKGAGGNKLCTFVDPVYSGLINSPSFSAYLADSQPDRSSTTASDELPAQLQTCILAIGKQFSLYIFFMLSGLSY